MLNNILNVIRHAQHSFSIKKPEILTGVGIIGFGATVADAIRRTPYAMLDLEEADEELYGNEVPPTRTEIVIAKVKAVTPHYISTAILGICSCGCFVGSLKESNKRLAASVAAYAIVSDESRYLKQEVLALEDKLAEKERLLEDKEQPKKGKKKQLNKGAEDKQPEDQLAKEVIPQSEEVLMCDKMSKRYFYCSPLKIKEAEAKLNRDLLLNMFVPLNDFYYEVGLSNSTLGEYFGWQAGDEIDFTFSSSLTEDNHPCVMIDYDVITHMSNRVNY